MTGTNVIHWEFCASACLPEDGPNGHRSMNLAVALAADADDEQRVVICQALFDDIGLHQTVIYNTSTRHSERMQHSRPSRSVSYR